MYSDGSGIASTLLKNEAKYHNGCRGRFRSYIERRDLDERAREEFGSDENVTKKTRSSFHATLDRSNMQCVCCERYQDDCEETIYRPRSKNCWDNLMKWAVESKNWVVHARLNTALDSEAGDVHHHTSCYTKLKNDA